MWNRSVILLTIAGITSAFTPPPALQKSILLYTATTVDEVTSERTIMTDEVDGDALFAASTFPIKPDDLIARAREVLSPDCGIGTKDGGECLANDFEFCAAVVGPIGREEYLGALDNFSLEKSFDITGNYYGLMVDPMQTNRVWFMNRIRGIHTGEFMGAKPTGKEIIYPPQTLHIDFNEDGKVKEFGFYTVDRRQGNTGGLGGAFGFMHSVGKAPRIPEFRPYKKSKRFRFLQFLGALGQRMRKKKEE